MSEKLSQPIGEFSAQAYETDLAQLVATKNFGGMLLTSFLLMKRGEENPYLGCVVEVKEGPDAGKRFVANVGKSWRLGEPLTITLVAPDDE